ncbi:hypothetical protein V8E55_005090 [Tylopilus felleus]
MSDSSWIYDSYGKCASEGSQPPCVHRSTSYQTGGTVEMTAASCGPIAFSPGLGTYDMKATIPGSDIPFLRNSVVSYVRSRHSPCDDDVGCHSNLGGLNHAIHVKATRLVQIASCIQQPYTIPFLPTVGAPVCFVLSIFRNGNRWSFGFHATAKHIMPDFLTSSSDLGTRPFSENGWEGDNLQPSGSGISNVTVSARPRSIGSPRCGCTHPVEYIAIKSEDKYKHPPLSYHCAGVSNDATLLLRCTESATNQGDVQVPGHASLSASGILGRICFGPLPLHSQKPPRYVHV